MAKIIKSLSLMTTAVCFSTMLLMSSCSKDDAQTPLPEATGTESSKLKLIGIIGRQIIPNSNSITGWSYAKITNPGTFGISSTKVLYNNVGTPWINSVDVPKRGIGTFLTFQPGTEGGSIQAFMKYLVKGKKYKFTFKVSTARINADGPYAPHVMAGIAGKEHPSYPDVHTIVVSKKVIMGAPNEWITESVTFTADDYLASGLGYVYFHLTNSWGSGPDVSKMFVNVFIDDNAIQEIN